MNQLHFQVGVIQDVAHLKLLFELFAETLEELCRLGTACEDEPHVTL